jgi:hypothetical protein
MARLALASGVSNELHQGGYVFSVATVSDDADMRRLLRDNPTPGLFSLSLEREPTLFSQSSTRVRQCLVVAREEKTGEAIGLCERVVRDAYLNGKVVKLPYLGGLRVAKAYRNRIGVLRGGFAALRRFAEAADEAPYSLTSIAADNETALRVLTRGIPSLPHYASICDYETFVLGATRDATGNNIRGATAADVPSLVDFLGNVNIGRNFAPCWHAADFEHLAQMGLPLSRILLSVENGKIQGCVGVWDQSGFKQSIIRGYPPMLAMLRPILNALAPVARTPHMPDVGQPLNLVSLAFMAAANENSQTLYELISGARSLAGMIGKSGVAFGFPTNNPLFANMRKRFRLAVTYKTRLFLVHWPENKTSLPRAATNPIMPEFACL